MTSITRSNAHQIVTVPREGHESVRSGTTGLGALGDIMVCFGNLESVGIEDCKVVHTRQDQQALELFDKSLKRCEYGHYEVGLPFKKDRAHLSNNFVQARRFLESTEKRLNKNPEVRSQYCKAMNEYQEKGFARQLSEEELNEMKDQEVYNVPHHGASKDESVSTTLRIVFNASSPDRNGVALNDVLLSGPPLQNDIVQVLIRFRANEVALFGDLQKMFCQTRIRKSDQRYQLFLWRDCLSEIFPRTYAMTCLMFGITSSPFLALNSLRVH